MIRKIIKLFDGSNESKWFQKQVSSIFFLLIYLKFI
jgi:hypothetical protein